MYKVFINPLFIVKINPSPIKIQIFKSSNLIGIISTTIQHIIDSNGLLQNINRQSEYESIFLNGYMFVEEVIQIEIFSETSSDTTSIDDDYVPATVLTKPTSNKNTISTSNY